MRPTKYTAEERKIRHFASKYKGDYKLDCTLEEAVEIVKAKRQAAAKKDEKIALAHSNGISRNAFRMRIYRGWTPEDAATKPLNRSGRPKKVNDYE